MSKVIGPVSTLPGFIRIPRAGSTCDNHPDQPAVICIQGETDSFGAELHHLCRDCEDKAKPNTTLKYQCAFCGLQDQVLKPTRDYDEGMYGPVYWVCFVCLKRQAEFLALEAEAFGDDDERETRYLEQENDDWNGEADG